VPHAYLTSPSQSGVPTESPPDAITQNSYLVHLYFFIDLKIDKEDN